MVACDLGLSYKRHDMPEPHHICTINVHSRGAALCIEPRSTYSINYYTSFIEGFVPLLKMQADIPETHSILLAIRQARLLHRSCHPRAAMALI